MIRAKYSIQIVRGDAAIVGCYVRKHEPDPSGLRAGTAFTRDLNRARVFRDRSAAERVLTKLDVRATGSVYEIVSL